LAFAFFWSRTIKWNLTSSCHLACMGPQTVPTGRRKVLAT
jgi:hypothetical protein